MDQRSYFIAQNTQQLQSGIDVLSGVDDEVYTAGNHDFFASGIGKHFRHIIDLYNCFLRAGNGRVDYDARERDPRIENDRVYAIEKAKEVIAGLNALGHDAATAKHTPEECLVNSNEGANPEYVTPWCESSLVRELQYLASHTVHHYAIIAMILRILGHDCPEHFGVAPSTIIYEESQ